MISFNGFVPSDHQHDHHEVKNNDSGNILVGTLGKESTQKTINCLLSRRQFLSRSVLAAAGATCAPALLPGRADDKLSSPIVVFTKVYQTLSLNFEDSAAITAEAQLDGVDIPVRPKGEVEPERVSEDLPRYAEALKKRGLAMPLLTTAITAVSSPHAETTLTTGKKLGTQYYRVGFLDRDTD